MSTLPFLVLVVLKPTIQSEDVWRDWFTTELLPRFVSNGIASRALLYREIPFPGIPASANSHNLLALIQTQKMHVHNAPQHGLLLKSDDSDQEDSSNLEMIKDLQTELRDYELIQDYYPEPRDNDPPEQLITIEMEPQDKTDFDSWYREEHIPLLELAPGYRRSTRYQLLSQEQFTGQAKPLKYLALHEVENVDQFMQSEETQKANSTAWTKRQVSSNETVSARAWKRIKF